MWSVALSTMIPPPSCRYGPLLLFPVGTFPFLSPFPRILLFCCFHLLLRWLTHQWEGGRENTRASSWLQPPRYLPHLVVRKHIASPHRRTLLISLILIMQCNDLNYASQWDYFDGITSVRLVVYLRVFLRKTATKWEHSEPCWRAIGQFRQTIYCFHITSCCLQLKGVKALK